MRSPVSRIIVRASVKKNPTTNMNPTTPTDSHEVLFYDGGCGLCHRVVKFVLKHDHLGYFHYAPMDGNYYIESFNEADRTRLAEKVVLLFPDGNMLLGTDAILHIFEKLDAPWPSFAPLVRLIPTALRDAAYNTVSHLRRKLFAPPPMVCPTMDPDEEKRFIL
jgi:predicted DCC family thiol-disulfide oxidoreductase YuxK